MSERSATDLEDGRVGSDEDEFAHNNSVMRARDESLIDLNSTRQGFEPKGRSVISPAAAAAARTSSLHKADQKLSSDLVSPFCRIDDLLHRAGYIRDDRHAVLLKLLLVKRYDEERAREGLSADMLIQDFSLLQGTPDSMVETVFDGALEGALQRYPDLLPHATPRAIGCSAPILREVSALLCQVRVLGARPQAIHDLFMYFCRFHAGIDLAESFIPREIIRLIVEITNPRAGERIVDPTCGTGDFLVGAKQVAEERHGINISDHLHGYDIAPLALHLTLFNLLLNGDWGLANILTRDTLLHSPEHWGHYDIALCNPPFGARILEKRAEALERFELVSAKKSGLGHKPRSQEVGLLFVESCVRAVRPGGRIGILVPNGYLGNPSGSYLQFRRWLLLNTRVAAVIALPRFTLKKSGMDVSASVLILERREQPLTHLHDVPDNPIHFNQLESVGWDLHSKHPTRIFKRDPRDGTDLRDESGERIADTDFEEARLDALTSPAVDAFSWMDKAARRGRTTEGWTIPASAIKEHSALSLDAKRWSRKHIETRAAIESIPHIKVGKVLRPVTRILRRKPEAHCRYVEIERIYEFVGTYLAEDRRGWALPGRGQLVAAPGDIFIANIWASAGKWMIAGDDAKDGHLIVTTGCSHFELIPGQESLLPDLVFGLCSEAFKVQMRACATGSDGLSTISVADMCSIVLPRIHTPEVRETIQNRIREARMGQLILPRIVRNELALVAPAANVAPRSSHMVVV